MKQIKYPIKHKPYICNSSDYGRIAIFTDGTVYQILKTGEYRKIKEN